MKESIKNFYSDFIFTISVSVEASNDNISLAQ